MSNQYYAADGPKIEHPTITVTHSADGSSYEFKTTNAGNLPLQQHTGEVVSSTDGAGVIHGRTVRQGDRASSVTLIVKAADFDAQLQKLRRAGYGGSRCTFNHPDDASDEWVISNVTKTGDRGSERLITVDCFPVNNGQ